VAGVAYNTNGFAHHRLEDALAILADAGYDGVALTPDVHHLDPLRATPAEVAAVDAACRRLGLSVIVETGARFVLDPARKHRPTLLDDAAGAARRLDFLCRCTDLGASLGARVVSTWSGALPAGLAAEEGCAGCRRCASTRSGEACWWPSSPSPACSWSAPPTGRA
jgi:sugar phosphate isomerase/epimerase